MARLNNGVCRRGCRGEASWPHTASTGDLWLTNTFDWLQLPDGRARFGGGIRGWDERGHETFALELAGIAYFGEIQRAYLENQNDYHVVIDAFGYRSEIEVGMPGTDVRQAFTPQEEAVARALAIQLVRAGLNFETPPFQLKQTETSHFIGDIIFRDDWMLVRSDDTGAA